jgi:hypothetical protein
MMARKIRDICSLNNLYCKVMYDGALSVYVVDTTGMYYLKVNCLFVDLNFKYSKTKLC